MNFLLACGISCASIDLLEGYHIPREILLDIERYEAVKSFIPELKKCFSSSRLTSLQSSAENNQQWPLLNLVRQVLKSLDYRLHPKRLANGYNLEGKKRYRRVFEIQKLKHVANSVEADK